MNDDRKQTLRELRIIFAKNDRKLEASKKQLIELSGFLALFRETEENIRDLKEFHQSATWMDGREILFGRGEGRYHLSAGEDDIWNVSNDLYSLKIKLIKMLGDSLLDELPLEQR